MTPVYTSKTCRFFVTSRKIDKIENLLNQERRARMPKHDANHQFTIQEIEDARPTIH